VKGGQGCPVLDLAGSGQFQPVPGDYNNPTSRHSCTRQPSWWCRWENLFKSEQQMPHRGRKSREKRKRKKEKE